ncbi:hypothetical protein ABID23_000631 [Bartonella silvatica]|uniref:Uncharacterized protein n=1 Tax=Bartonella silvatica TaxID=357760 RepID=A0ABV2HG88_9HYPH
MDFLRHRIVFILFVFSVSFAAFFVPRSAFLKHFLLNPSLPLQQVSVTEEDVLERVAVSFPGLIAHLSQMDSEKQKQFIEQVRREVVIIAYSNGRNSEQAQELGRMISVVLLKLVSRPSFADDYF